MFVAKAEEESENKASTSVHAHTSPSPYTCTSPHAHTSSLPLHTQLPPPPTHTHSVNIVQITSKKNLAGDPSESEWNYCESELISVKVGFLSVSAFPPAVSARELWLFPFVIVVMSITPAVSVKGNVLLLWVHSLIGNVYPTHTHPHTHPHPPTHSTHSFVLGTLLQISHELLLPSSNFVCRWNTNCSTLGVSVCYVSLPSTPVHSKGRDIPAAGDSLWGLPWAHGHLLRETGGHLHEDS